MRQNNHNKFYQLLFFSLILLLGGDTMKNLNNEELLKVHGGCLRIRTLYKAVKVIFKSLYYRIKILAN